MTDMLTPVLTDNWDADRSWTLDSYQAHGGYDALRVALGMDPDDVITAVNNQDVKSIEHFRELMGQVEKGRIVALLVRRGGNSLYVPFRANGS